MTLDEIRTTHAAEIAQIKADLMNFDIPAQRAINAGFERMSLNRFPNGDDLWEMIVCAENGWQYEKPARHLTHRWASY